VSNRLAVLDEDVKHAPRRSVRRLPPLPGPDRGGRTQDRRAIAESLSSLRESGSDRLIEDLSPRRVPTGASMPVLGSLVVDLFRHPLQFIRRFIHTAHSNTTARAVN
jgi:hypothetical protein